MSQLIGTDGITIEKGIEIQQKQLLQWKEVLKEDKFERLNNYCNKCNEVLVKQYGMHAYRGFSVFRGNDLDSFIHNNLILNNNFFKE